MTYRDTYLTGPIAVIEAVLAENAALPRIGPRTLDAMAHLCLRTEGEQVVRLPADLSETLEELTRYPQTARALLGGFYEPEPDAPVSMEEPALPAAPDAPIGASSTAPPRRKAAKA